MSRRRSNTTSSKTNPQPIEESITSNDHEQLVKVVVRRNGQTGKQLKVPKQLTQGTFHQLIEKKFYIMCEKQVLYHCGQRMVGNQIDGEKNIFFSQNDVIHVHNRTNIDKLNIKVTFYFLNSDLIKYQEEIIEQKKEKSIEKILSQDIDLTIEKINKCFCFQSGRFLTNSKSLEEQSIQNQSVILLLLDSATKPKVSILKEREIKLCENKIQNKKEVWFGQNQIYESSNFKKKSQCFTCRSIILPETLELLWQEETNKEEYQRVVMSKILWKKKGKKRILTERRQELLEDDKQSSIKHSKSVRNYKMINIQYEDSKENMFQNKNIFLQKMSNENRSISFGNQPQSRLVILEQKN